MLSTCKGIFDGSANENKFVGKNIVDYKLIIYSKSFFSSLKISLKFFFKIDAKKEKMTLLLDAQSQPNLTKTLHGQNGPSTKSTWIRVEIFQF